jgi:hypothetical protein
MYENKLPNPPNPVRRPAFSDRLERRRGQRDAELGRAPASVGRAYMSGYSEGRRRSNGRRDRNSARTRHDSKDGSPSHPTASPELVAA